MKKRIVKMISLALCMAFIFGAFPVNDAVIEANAGATLYWPVPGHYSLSRTFANHGYQAIDISDGSINGVPVIAAIGGKIEYITLCPNNHWAEIESGVNPGNLDCDGFGYGIIIHGDDGRWYQYAHMQAKSFPGYVYHGAHINAGQQIGLVGNTGASTGPHLHFEINTTGMFSGHVDPMKETYGNVATEVYYSSYPEKYSVSETDATLSTIITTNVSITSISTVGIILYDRDGTELARKSETPTTSGVQIKAWYYVTSELGKTLNPGTQYNYKFFSVIGSQTYYSDLYSFTTNGTCSHSYTTSVKDATCAQAGEKTSVCTKCGDQKTETIPATENHAWNNGIVTKEPTVSETGIKTYTCTVCNDTKTEVIEKLDGPIEYDAEVTVDTVTTTVGTTVTVDVNITKTAPLSYLRFVLDYDKDVLTLQGVENGELFDTLDIGTNFVFSHDGDTDKTGKLMTLTFTVSNEAEAGDYAVELNCREAYNFDEEDVAVSVNNGKITVMQYILGDVNADNEVNGKDLVRLRKYLADVDENIGASSVEIGGGSDVTGDGIVNGKDLIRMRKYFANFNEETGKSTVELG